MTATTLVKTYQTRNPATIAERLGIEIVYCDLPERVEGFYISVLGNKYFVINRGMVEEERRATIAHELGHYLKHTDLDFYFIMEKTFFCIGKLDREVEQFAADLLIDAKKVCEYIRAGMTLEQISKIIHVPYQLLNLKYNKG